MLFRRANKFKVFSSFEQLNYDTSRKYGGSGLGLSIAKKLAQAMNGEVGFSSNLDKGSNFWVVLELKKTEIITSVNNVIDDNIVISKLKNKKILIVEDDEINKYF